MEVIEKGKLECVSQSVRILFLELKNLSIESSSAIVGILIDILMTEAKPVATQNIKFEDSIKYVSKTIFGALVQSGFWCKKKTDYFLIDWFVTTPENSTGILMQQIEPETSKKIEFEHRVKSKFIATTGTFGPSGFCCEEQNRHPSNLNVCSKLNLFDWDRGGGTQASTTGETLIWKPRWFKTDPSLPFRTSRFFCKNQKENYSIESSTTTVELLTDLLMGETKPVATQNVKFDDWIRSSSNSVLWPWYNQDSDAREKTGYFLIDWFVTSS